MLTVAGLGLIVGIVLALTGAGGGILAVPLLIFGVGLGVAQAAPTGLLAVGMAAALGAGVGLKAGTVRYKAALLIAAVGMLFSPLGIWLANRINRVKVLFGFVLLGTSIWFVARVLPATLTFGLWGAWVLAVALSLLTLAKKLGSQNGRLLLRDQLFFWGYGVGRW